jgi:hypothetical protein
VYRALKLRIVDSTSMRRTVQQAAAAAAALKAEKIDAFCSFDD